LTLPLRVIFGRVAVSGNCGAFGRFGGPRRRGCRDGRAGAGFRISNLAESRDRPSIGLPASRPHGPKPFASRPVSKAAAVVAYGPRANGATCGKGEGPDPGPPWRAWPRGGPAPSWHAGAQQCGLGIRRLAGRAFPVVGGPGAGDAVAGADQRLGHARESAFAKPFPSAGPGSSASTEAGRALGQALPRQAGGGREVPRPTRAGVVGGVIGGLQWVTIR